MRRRKNKQPPFVAMPWAMIDSPAWEKLSNASRVAYIHIKRQARNSHPGDLKLPYSDMDGIMKRHTFARSIRQLEALGFIERSQIGGLYRRTNLFRLSEEWKTYSSSAQKGTVDSAQKGTVGSDDEN